MSLLFFLKTSCKSNPLTKSLNSGFQTTNPESSAINPKLTRWFSLDGTSWSFQTFINALGCYKFHSFLVKKDEASFIVFSKTKDGSVFVRRI